MRRPVASAGPVPSPRIAPTNGPSPERAAAHAARVEGLGRRSFSEGGFTLIELLLVVVIIGILAALVIPKFAGRTEEAKKAAAQQDISTLAQSLDSYEIDLGKFPATEEGLNALIAAPSGLKDPTKWKGPYIQKKEIPLDPWGNPYKYVYPGHAGPKTYDLNSTGADGQEGTEDDVSH